MGDAFVEPAITLDLEGEQLVVGESERDAAAEFGVVFVDSRIKYWRNIAISQHGKNDVAFSIWLAGQNVKGQQCSRRFWLSRAATRDLIRYLSGALESVDERMQQMEGNADANTAMKHLEAD
jgi:hypothetical protein